MFRKLRGRWLIRRGNLKILRGRYLVEKGLYLLQELYPTTDIVNIGEDEEDYEDDE